MAGRYWRSNRHALATPTISCAQLGSMRAIPVVDADGRTVRVGRHIGFGLACDHRVLDGAKGARLLEEIKRILEHPQELLESSVDHGA